MKLVLCTLALLIAAPAYAHDWYGKLQSPITNGSCCSDKDCHPTKAEPDEDGVWWVYDEGVRRRVPPLAILHTTAPDGNSHVCINSAHAILCFIKGVPKS